eukprot:TRINITY_DN2030_c0_g1_i3.p1 TRINITY_DN2030_c0_g1~~TRINITY_DN2030_c0_g1_i3.p1  ORF type:complete len:232 (+),score=47.30 TRINITY_DN2030_c0_g1_i3:208-903(+)
MSVKVLRILYNFEPAEEVELGCKTGDIVVTEVTDLDDEWILVQRYDRPAEKGYVPKGYLGPVAESEASTFLETWKKAKAELAEKKKAAKSPSTTTTTTSGSGKEATPASPSSSGAVGTSSSSTGAGVKSPTNTSGGAAAGAGATTGEAVNKSVQLLAEMCTRHENRIREISADRKAQFAKLEEQMKNAAAQIRDCQTRNNDVSSRITEMETLIDNEKRKWQTAAVGGESLK